MPFLKQKVSSSSLGSSSYASSSGTVGYSDLALLSKLLISSSAGHGSGPSSLSATKEASRYSLPSDAKSTPGSTLPRPSQMACTLPLERCPEKSRGLGPSERGSHVNMVELYASPSQVTNKVSRIVGCHAVLDTLPWNTRAALSSAAVTSQTHSVLGASPSLVARSADDGSNDKRTQPDRDEELDPDSPFGGVMVWEARTNW